MTYEVIERVSLEAAHVRLICVLDAEVAVNEPGALGGDATDGTLIARAQTIAKSAVARCITTALRGRYGVF
jgi:hypothetical protein